MTTINEAEVKNPYIYAADMRCILHNIIVNNKYGFTILFLKKLSEKYNSQFDIPDDIEEGGLYPYEFTFNYDLEEEGFNKDTKIDMKNIHAILYVNILSIISDILVNETIYLYNNYDNIDNDLYRLYEFMICDTANRCVISMLFDVRIFMNSFTLIF